VSTEAREFIKTLLVIDPKKRPTAEEAQKHPWLREWARRGHEDDDHKLSPNVVSALVNFKEYSDVRKLLSEVLSFTLLPDQIKDLRDEFEKIDTDGSGEISLSALKQVLLTNAEAGSLGSLTEDEVEDIFNAMRVKKSATRIRWHEFIAATLSLCQIDERHLRLAFDRLDSDHKGYLTFENVIDLMGTDVNQSEDVMRSMWVDSMAACNCQHGRIPYENFLLFMKGQTQEAEEPPQVVETTGPITSSSVLFLGDPPPTSLHMLQELRSEDEHYHSNMIVLPSGDVVNIADGAISEGKDELMTNIAPTTPPTFRTSFTGTLTPPMSPVRGPAKHITPRESRRCSHPVDDQDTRADVREEDADVVPVFVADARRAIHLPENGHYNCAIDNLVKDKSKTPLVVNRTLYRAHRQMRHAVLEASKRFEEQRTQRACEMLITEGGGAEEGKNDPPYVTHVAGLVLLHGEKRKITSEAVRTWLIQNEQRQEALIENANKRGGRGRKTKNKTISDMAGMLASMNSDENSGVPLSNTIFMEETPSGPQDGLPYNRALGKSEGTLELSTWRL
jgi:Ca2+-binding EF-hand superfamily protein